MEKEQHLSLGGYADVTLHTLRCISAFAVCFGQCRQGNYMVLFLHICDALMVSSADLELL